MGRVRVVQQYVNVENNGGLQSEYRAMCQRASLSERYEFLPVVLNGCHGGISPSDICFYAKAIRKASPDIVHIRGAGVESLNAVIGAKLAGRGKILLTVHGMFRDLVYYNPVKRWICKNIIERLIFGLSDGISCVCEATTKRDVFKPFRNKLLPCVYNRMPTYFPCGIDEIKTIRAEWKLPADAVTGIYVGRITKEKGLSYLVDALEQLDRNWPERFHLLIVGDGEYRPEMQAECAKLIHASQVVFAGHQNCVQTLLNASDFFLTPSLHENLSISILEACAAGIPCLVTNVGGNGEIIADMENGLLIPSRSAQAIAGGIVRLCDPQLRSTLRRRAAQMDYSRFSDDCVDAQLRAVYEKLLQ